MRTKIGLVVSAKSPKTAKVLVTRSITHPKYGKRYQVSRHFQVHDPANLAKAGDKVEIVEGRPISKSKCWRLKAKLNSFQEKSTQAAVKAETPATNPAKDPTPTA